MPLQHSPSVTALMDTIISKNIFLAKNESGAQLTQKAVTKFELD